MKLDEVLRLIDAGFTADEVRAMGGPQKDQEKPAEDEKPAEKPQGALAVSADDVRTIVAEQLKAALQKANARSAERTAGADKPKTAQDIIKELTKNM